MVKASDLVKEQNEREKKKKLIFKKIYKRIEVKVQQASSANLFECWYDIPEFILNLPLYNLEDCKIYIINKLNKNGFKTGVFINNIWISWRI